jgi:hypothetical protein
LQGRDKENIRERDTSKKRKPLLIISKDLIKKANQKPLVTIKYDFAEESYQDILQSLHILEQNNGFCEAGNRNKPAGAPTLSEEEVTHLSRHNISELSRAKMIDWMFEVLNAFKMSL